MQLGDVMTIPVRPVEGQEHWFEFDGKPVLTYYNDIDVWIEEQEDHGAKRVMAGIIGWDDDEEFCERDPRFNDRAGTEMTVVQRPDGTYLLGFALCGPETLIFQYMLELEAGKPVVPYPRYRHGSREKWQEIMAEKAADAVPAKKAATKKKTPKKTATA